MEKFKQWMALVQGGYVKDLVENSMIPSAFWEDGFMAAGQQASESTGNSGSGSGKEGKVFVPRAVLYQSDAEYLAGFELPGVEKRQVELILLGTRLTVRGSRSEPDPGWAPVVVEAGCGPFERTLELPVTVDEGTVLARLMDGMLWVRLQKLCKPESSIVIM